MEIGNVLLDLVFAGLSHLGLPHSNLDRRLGSTTGSPSRSGPRRRLHLIGRRTRYAGMYEDAWVEVRQADHGGAASPARDPSAQPPFRTMPFSGSGRLYARP